MIWPFKKKKEREPRLSIVPCNMKDCMHWHEYRLMDHEPYKYLDSFINPDLLDCLACSRYVGTDIYSPMEKKK